MKLDAHAPLDMGWHDRARSPSRAGSAAAALAALTALAAVLRAIGLDSGLWFDEIVTLVMSVRLPLSESLTAFPSNNNHPLYTLLGHLSVGALGEHAWTLRLPAAVFGVAAVPMIYVLGRTVASRWEALAAATLLAVSYHHIWFSQNARGYTALAFWTLLSTWLLLRGLREPRTIFFMGYAAAAALGAYTHLTMVFVVAAHALVVAWIVVRPEPDAFGSASSSPDGWKLPANGFVLSGVLTFVLYAPMLPQVFGYFSGPPQKTAEVATAQWAFWEMLRGLRIGMGGLGLVAAGLLALAGFWSYVRQSRTATALFVLPGVLTGVAMVGLRAPIRPRFFFLLVGFGVLFLVRGITVAADLVARRLAGGSSMVRTRQLAGAALVALLVVASLASLPYGYRYPKQDFDGALKFMESEASEEDAIATAGLAVYPFAHYYRKPWTGLERADEFEAARRRGRRVWLVYSFPEYMHPELVALIRRDCATVRSFPGTLGGGDVVVCRAEGAGGGSR